VIAGDGPLRDEVRKSAGKNVTFTGELSQPTLLATMKAARFLVFPTAAYETFGMTVLEAAACGVASIGSRLGAVPELVQDGQTGLLFDAGNCDELAERVGWAWSHPVSMNEMGAAARRRYLKHHTAKRGYEGLSSLYGSVSPEWAEAEEQARSRGWQDHSPWHLNRLLPETKQGPEDLRPCNSTTH
jgi:glycosyltransferase involved in cell wall biosynthesis